MDFYSQFTVTKDCITVSHKASSVQCYIYTCHSYVTMYYTCIHSYCWPVLFKHGPNSLHSMDWAPRCNLPGRPFSTKHSTFSSNTQQIAPRLTLVQVYWSLDDNCRPVMVYQKKRPQPSQTHGPIGMFYYKFSPQALQVGVHKTTQCLILKALYINYIAYDLGAWYQGLYIIFQMDWMLWHPSTVYNSTVQTFPGTLLALTMIVEILRA